MHLFFNRSHLYIMPLGKQKETTNDIIVIDNVFVVSPVSADNLLT